MSSLHGRDHVGALADQAPRQSHAQALERQRLRRLALDHAAQPQLAR